MHKKITLKYLTTYIAHLILSVFPEKKCHTTFLYIMRIIPQFTTNKESSSHGNVGLISKGFAPEGVT